MTNLTPFLGLNLTDLSPGRYELLCLLIEPTGNEGAIARAMLRDIATKGNQQIKREIL